MQTNFNVEGEQASRADRKRSDQWGRSARKLLATLHRPRGQELPELYRAIATATDPIAMTNLLSKINDSSPTTPTTRSKKRKDRE